MPNGKSSMATLELDVPTYLPLSEAVRKYELSEKVLTQLIQAGKIEAVRLPSGELLVSADNKQPKTKEQIIAEKFAGLRENPITVTEAAQKYNLHRDTVLEWKKQRYISVLKPGYRMELDEAEVAYCAEIYHQRKGRSGVPLLDENGLPYQLKHPGLSRYRQSKRLTD